ANGIRQIPSSELGPIVLKGTNSQTIFYVVAIFAGIAIYMSWRLLHSRIGRAWAALREDESVADSMGVNTVNMKLLAFVIGAILAGFAGMIFSVKVGSVFPQSFSLLVSVIILVIVIVGGMGSIVGVMVGAAVLIGVLGGPTQPGLLAEVAEYKLLLYGAILVFMMLKRPEGLWPSVRRQRELHQEEFLQDAWLEQQAGGDEAENEDDQLAQQAKHDEGEDEQKIRILEPEE
ncbi:MAG: branched-chain amino acid ABC transporter permease, partial [Actinobacteria bacterium]|nr:branched-chain amino acid ABC transporter permease [Actinomycetota bacterium]